MIWIALCASSWLAYAAGPDEPLWTSLPLTDASSARARMSIADLVERARPAVVAIHTSGLRSVPGEGFPFNPWRLFPEVPESERVKGIGSGFVLRADGLVLTNHHVIFGAERVWVRVAGLGKRLPARVLGSDPRSDLALLRIDSPRALPVLPLGDSDRLRPGAWVVAIGNPFGLTHVATKGIVSGKGRMLGDLMTRSGFFDFIQTDAAIDRGNSGGPLLNLRGEVVGINTAVNSRACGIGFAVPVNLVKAVLPHLHRHGRLVRSYLGITIDDVDWDLARSSGLDRVRGVVVTEVRPDTPAQRAGMKKGDIILRFGRSPIEGRADLGWRAATWPSGRLVRIVVWRDRQERGLEIVPVVRAGDAQAAGSGRGEQAPSR